MTFLNVLLSALITLPSLALAGSMNNEDCGNRVNQLTSFQRLQKRLCDADPRNCGMLQQAAWRRDQDNSMSDSDEKPARAMAMIIGRGGTSAAVQVCPGVYLATAHGALDNPHRARRENRPLRSPRENISAMSAFPVGKENKMKASSTVEVISPRLRDPSTWDDLGGRGAPETDYAFITVDKIVRPNDFLTPLNYEQEELLNASADRALDVNMFRPKTMYATDETGHPVEAKNEHGALVFDESTHAKGADFFNNLRSAQKVNRRCDLFDKNNNGMIRDNCPSEAGVSGSPYTTKIGGEVYLLGVQHSSSGNVNIPNGSDSPSSGQFIMTKQFCSDFQTACGKPCPDLSETLPQQSGVSI